MSSSAYPVIWALKHAPVIDAEERAILLALADHGDPDGCDAFPSVATMARVALVSESTVHRKLAALQKRGVIRRQTGLGPARWRALPPYRRPTIYELMIPCSWWSDAQRAEIDRMREERGRPPLTPSARPDLAPAPPRRARSDKGKPAPNRRRRKNRETAVQQAVSAVPGVSETPVVDNPDRGVTETPHPLSSRHPTPCLEDTQPSCPNPPEEPSSSYARAPVTAVPAPRHAQEEQEAKPPADNQPDDGPPPELSEALTVVDRATAMWGGHRLPTASERLRLAERAAEALSKGARRADLVHALSRDLSHARSAVAVAMARTADDDWWRFQTAPATSAPPQRPRPEWCGHCDENTRLLEPEVGTVRRCPECHPLSTQATALTP